MLTRPRLPGPTVSSWLAAVAGVGLAATGAWAMLAPRSFYDGVATYPPFNEHLLHDIGAFLVGLGACLVVALWVRDGLVVALAGNVVGAVLHAVSHVVDRDLGGSSRDPWTMSALALALLLALVLRARWLHRARA